MMWRQRNGTLIDVRDMGHGHLEATIRMLRRSIDRVQRVGIDQVFAIASLDCRGEGAQHAQELAIDELSNTISWAIDQRRVIIRRMAGELVARDLEEIT